jgi:hypothetical protein
MDRLTATDLNTVWPDDVGWPQDIGVRATPASLTRRQASAASTPGC